VGYLHISNLYKDQDVLLFKEVYALEKVHGTSAHVAFTCPLGEPENGELRFFSGGEKHAKFLDFFDQDDLLARFQKIGHEKVVVFGEAYGGKQQGMSHTYGKEMCFIAFDVKVGDTWLNVPNAHDVATKLGLEFVPYEKVPATVEALDAERDRPSRVAKRRGIEEDKVPEGIVIRPLVEVVTPRGSRIISKHKGDKFNERSTVQKVQDPAKLKVLAGAQAIAREWVTPMRLEHVLDKLPPNPEMKDIPVVIKAMLEDVFREAEGEVVDSKPARKAISSLTVKLFSLRMKNALRGE
jgi:hypothetical protein